MSFQNLLPNLNTMTLKELQQYVADLAKYKDVIKTRMELTSRDMTFAFAVAKAFNRIKSVSGDVASGFVVKGVVDDPASTVVRGKRPIKIDSPVYNTEITISASTGLRGKCNCNTLRLPTQEELDAGTYPQFISVQNPPRHQGPCRHMISLMIGFNLEYLEPMIREASSDLDKQSKDPQLSLRVAMRYIKGNPL